METTEINFLPKPPMQTANLAYARNPKNIYVNLFEVVIKKPIKLNQYPYSISPEVEAGDLRVRDRLFKYTSKRLKEVYGECFISGDSLYGMKKVEEMKTFTTKIYVNGLTEYTITLQKCSNEKIINQADIHKDPLSKQFIEILVKDILRANPNLDFYKGLFVRKDQKKKIESNRTSVYFYPGFTTSFMETQGGNYLNVTLKNKIISTETVLDLLKREKYQDNRNQQRLKDILIGRSFKVSYSKKNYIIDDVIFNKNPENQSFLYEGHTVTLMEYYKTSHQIEIKDKRQPLLAVHKKGSQEDKDMTLYFIPELSYLAGLDDAATRDGDFMKQLAFETKLKPSDRVRKTNEFLNLLISKEKIEGKLSPFEKSQEYGIEIKPINTPFQGYYMPQPNLIGGRGNVRPNDKVFDVLVKKRMDKWVCVYDKRNYNDAETLDRTLRQASRGYGLQVREPEWIEMAPNARLDDWLYEGDEAMRTGNYDFIVYLLDRNDHFYPAIKQHSLCNNGYVSQVIKTKSLRKNAMSVCSKILLQINAKLQGASYRVQIDQNFQDRKLMVIGVDSSHIKGHRTGVAMVASVNESFTNFYNKEQIIEEANKEKLQFCVGSFIKSALPEYKRINQAFPQNIIIYRQGVSLQQKEYLKNEIAQVKKACDEAGVKYYYVLVNTKTTYKFFEHDNQGYTNPGAGLLMMEGITNRNFFEFYIQPQEVTGGSATPTCFHVAHGNIDFPEMVPKLTFDLCHVYSNWQGAVRVPNVIKSAEKLSKMTAKYTLRELNQNLKLGQAYL